jgi:redox-sensing transcriptional repressor
MTNPAPLPSIRRLPLYLRFALQAFHEQEEHLSCTAIAEALNSDPTQVRKDLALTGIVGKPRVGYPTVEVIESIRRFLGWENTRDAFLVGAGRLGQALMGYKHFREQNGLNICMAFDQRSGEMGGQVNGVKVMSLSALPEMARRMHVLIGILAVPARASGVCANIMVEGGIRAIWNFAPAILDVPENVIVENVHLSTSLAVLTNRLQEALGADFKEGVNENANKNTEKV